MPKHAALLLTKKELRVITQQASRVREEAERELAAFLRKFPKAEPYRNRMAKILMRGKANTLLGAYRKALP